MTAASTTPDEIVDAFLALLEERAFDEVTLRTVALRSGVPLSALNSHFATRGHLIDAFIRRIDQVVLAGDFSDMADEPGRERLFDVLMARLDACRPYRGAIKSLLGAARRDPLVAVGLVTMTQRSMAWMLAAAGLSATGWRGRMAVQGLTAAFANVLKVFVDEDDAGMPRTMARLDKELRALEERHKRFARIFGEAIQKDQPDPIDATPEAAAPEPAPAEPDPPAPEPETPPEPEQDEVAAPSPSDDADDTKPNPPEEPRP